MTKYAIQYTGGALGSKKIKKVDLSKPVSSTSKSVTYSQADNTLLLDVADAVSETAAQSGQFSAVRVRNDGSVAANAIFAYTKYTSETDTSEAVEFVQYLLAPEEEITLPASRAIIATTNEQYDGTPITAQAPAAAMKIDVPDTEQLNEALDTSETDVDVDDGNYFLVGDLLRIDDEIMEVVSISSNTLTVVRGSHGSTKAAHLANASLEYPFFNAYHDFDKYSVCQTDDNGRFKAQNFFGYGRGGSGKLGITAGSVAIQFYEAGFAKLGLSDITSNTESGLTASTAFEFDITVDGGTTFDNLSFTTDSSNTKFGGSNGVIAKIQDALDTQYYTAGNLFEKKVIVSIENGDVIFRSGSNLSTSAVVLGAGSSGTAEFLGSGRIPASPTSVDARLAQELEFNPVTNSSSFKNIFIRDDGRGNLKYKTTQDVGSCNYESGALDFTVGDKPNAEFVVSVLHTSPFSGKLNAAGADRANSLKQVLANTPQQKCESILTIETF
tara:strand:+ start:1868 stop:3361 length:1494 start_codon:yes stop_codon:yes gene_type:complete